MKPDNVSAMHENGNLVYDTGSTVLVRVPLIENLCRLLNSEVNVVYEISRIRNEWWMCDMHLTNEFVFKSIDVFIRRSFDGNYHFNPAVNAIAKEHTIDRPEITSITVLLHFWKIFS